jgi:Domain of unknown function (DUF4349)
MDSPASEPPPAGDIAAQNLEAPAAPEPANTPKMPAVKPQLIRNGALVVEVKSVEDAIKTATRILKAQQGDLMGLQDSRPSDGNTPYVVEMQIRVPQARLDATIEALGKLGTIQSQSITAEDVSTQLVDLSARLRSLRATETRLQELMQRSGSVRDILVVSQELSKVRETIEQLDAQYTNLRNQVAYSKITLTLQSELAAQTPQQDLGTQLQGAWNGSTRALYGLSVGMMKLLITLLVFSPYWGTILFLVIWWQRRRKARKTQRLLTQPPVPSQPIASQPGVTPSVVPTHPPEQGSPDQGSSD